MYNLLPAVANADATNDEYRARHLPYQQWEVARTYHAPSTPPDVSHLLPPIRDGERVKCTQIGDIPRAPRLAKKSVSYPAPIDCNISGLYDPALDPSPIGLEERGTIQPLHTTRIVKSCNKPTPASHPERPAHIAEYSIGTTSVTILNGHRRGEVSGKKSNEQADDSEEEGPKKLAIDVYLHGLPTRMKHATLEPSEMFHRTHQRKRRYLPDLGSSSNAERDARSEITEKTCSSGLTVLLCGAGDWLNCQPLQDSQDGILQDCIDMNDLARECSPPSTRTSQTSGTVDTLFRNKYGQPCPSKHAFRVQFEPGPLGMELEEDCHGRGLVRIRRILQASQAEQDGRLSPGFLVIAVGNSINISEHGGLNTLSEDMGDYRPKSESSRLRMIRCLADFEEAIMHQDPHSLFVVWMLDRFSPDAVATLGSPAVSSTDLMHCWRSPQSISAERGEVGLDVKTSCCHYFHKDASEGFSHSNPGGKVTCKSPSYLGDSGRQATREGVPHTGESGKHCLEPTLDGAASRWGSPNSPALGQSERQYSWREMDPPCESDAETRTRGEHHHHTRNATPQTPSASERRLVDSLPSGMPRPPDARDSASDLCHVSKSITRDKEKWEFETGGGIFDEHDQGLAARRPGGGNSSMRPGNVQEENTVEETPSLPLGLQASTDDDITIFIWFCNSHASGLMHVSWIDYDGRLVPRRALTPGSCYFERSFASHPWVVQYSADASPSVNGSTSEPHLAEEEGNSTNPSGKAAGDGKMCVLRLSGAMAVTRFTGCLIWNPCAMNLSLMKQAKVGVASNSLARLAGLDAEGVEGAGVAPGRKRLCLVGAEREAEAVRRAAARARIRREKARVLDEMREWRMHPPLGMRIKREKLSGGVGAGAPNIKFVMIGSSRKLLGDHKQR